LLFGYADNAILKELDVEDRGVCLIKMADNVIATVTLNFYQKPSDRYFKIVFEKGTLLWEFNKGIITLNNEEIAVEKDPHSMYLQMWRKFFEKGQAALEFELESCFRSLNLIGQMHKSNK
jgi:predicted dehydrogenase